MEQKFYDGNKLLQLLDIEKNTPEIYIVSGNRTGGKTTYFNRKLVKDYLEKGMRFGVLVRDVAELDSLSDQFFKEVIQLFFPEHTYNMEPAPFGRFLFLDEDICGYAFSLKHADKIKKQSHLLSDCSQYIFDEFQAKRYLKNEIGDFISIHTSIARGGGKQVRYCPVYMLSNKLSLLNPYFTAMGISARLKSDTKFLRGRGWVMEQNYNESAYLQQQASGFIKAFASVDDGAQMVYLEEKESFIERPESYGRYMCTVVMDGKSYGISEHQKEGIMYASKKYDPNFPYRFVVSSTDHASNHIMLKRGDMLITELRSMFEHGAFRFSDVATKAAVLQLLSY